MAKKNTKPVRLPPKITLDLDNALDIRFKNNLIKKKNMTYPEAMRLIGRTPEWKQVIEKLKTEPKKEDIDGKGLF